MSVYRKRLSEKLTESLKATLPIVAIVLLLSLFVAPIRPDVLLAFLLGAVLLVVGMMLFSLGAEVAMEPMGEKLGTHMTKTRKLWLILFISFGLGCLITMAEPDLQVLANQVNSIPTAVMIFSVAGGVGLFLAVALLRTLLGFSLRLLLIAFYAATFILAAFAPPQFLAIAFDSGGVTTGPMTVPFIMAFGVGVSAIRSDERAADDSFGLISLCSVGPILAVLILCLIYRPDAAAYDAAWMDPVTSTIELGTLFGKALPHYLGEMALALLPVTAVFGLFQLFSLKLNKKTVIRIGVGLLQTYAGLVLFLTGVNVGFMPAGSYLGYVLAGLEYKWIIIPLGMLIGYFIVKAEPAVYVLMRQVESITDGAVSGRALQISLSVGVAASVGLAMLRVLTGIPVMYMLIPGYAVAVGLSFFVPNIFTAIAFDSGGVASGPMTATFLLPFAIGACAAVGGNVTSDAFGVVAMVAMTPLVTIQILGIVYTLKQRAARRAGVAPVVVPAAEDEYTVIEL